MLCLMHPKRHCCDHGFKPETFVSSSHIAPCVLVLSVLQSSTSHTAGQPDLWPIVCWGDPKVTKKKHALIPNLLLLSSYLSAPLSAHPYFSSKSLSQLMHCISFQGWQSSFVRDPCTGRTTESHLDFGLPLMHHRVLCTQSATSPNANRPLHILQLSQRDKTLATFLWSRHLGSCEKPNSCSSAVPHHSVNTLLWCESQQPRCSIHRAWHYAQLRVPFCFWCQRCHFWLIPISQRGIILVWQSNHTVPGWKSNQDGLHTSGIPSMGTNILSAYTCG